MFFIILCFMVLTRFQTEVSCAEDTDSAQPNKEPSSGRLILAKEEEEVDPLDYGEEIDPLDVVYNTTATAEMFDFKNTLWKDGVVPYVISTEYNDVEKGDIMTAMKIIQNVSCVLFVDKKSVNYSDFVNIRKGKKGDPCGPSKVDDHMHDLLLSSECLKKGYGEVLHQLMRVIGCQAEVQRPDRDAYVEVLWQNVAPDDERHFSKRPWGSPQDAMGEYDYDSIVHYSAISFSKDGKLPTIRVKGQPRHVADMGQQRRLSTLDVKKLNRMYDCGVDAEDLATVKAIEEELRPFVQQLVDQCGDYPPKERELCLAMLAQLNNG